VDCVETRTLLAISVCVLIYTTDPVISLFSFRFQFLCTKALSYARCPDSRSKYRLRVRLLIYFGMSGNAIFPASARYIRSGIGVGSGGVDYLHEVKKKTVDCGSFICSLLPCLVTVTAADFFVSDRRFF